MYDFKIILNGRYFLLDFNLSDLITVISDCSIEISFTKLPMMTFEIYQISNYCKTLVEMYKY